MNKVFLLLGANLGKPVEQLARASQEITVRIGVIEMRSAIYETEAWGVVDQPKFLNQVLLVATELSPLEVLDRMQAIENDLGRIRLSKWGARMIDIDMLYFNNECIQHERLTIPHPYLPERRFVLVPLFEIAPQFIHPTLQVSNALLLEHCEDQLDVHIYSPKDDDTL